jgi:hypothetical protein
MILVRRGAIGPCPVEDEAGVSVGCSGILERLVSTGLRKGLI